MEVSHAGADDNGLWFFGFAGLRENIQVESSTTIAPFVVEHDDMSNSTDQNRGANLDQAVDAVLAYLHRLIGKQR